MVAGKTYHPGKNRREKDNCVIFFTRRRFKEEAMQIEEFLEESADLLQWLDEADTILQTKDPSPADEDALEDLVDKIKVWDGMGEQVLRMVHHKVCRGGAVVRLLASHQCGPGSIPGLGVRCGLSLLLVLVLAPRDFFPGTPVFPFLRNQHF